jgi:hypothetical protein
VKKYAIRQTPLKNALFQTFYGRWEDWVYAPVMEHIRIFDSFEEAEETAFEAVFRKPSLAGKVEVVRVPEDRL